MRRAVRLLAACALLACVAAASAPAASAAGASPAWWHMWAYTAPGHLGQGEEAFLEVTARNDGWGDVAASAGDPVVFTVTLSSAATPLRVQGLVGHGGTNLPCTVAGQTVTCRDTGIDVAASETLAMRVSIKTASGLPEGTQLQYSAQVEGGDGRVHGEAGMVAAMVPRSITRVSPVDGATTRFAVEQLQVTPEARDGSIDTQAGSHPFQLTTSLQFTKFKQMHHLFGNEAIPWPRATAQPKNLRFSLPPGLVGDLTRTPRCAESDFAIDYTGWTNACPENSAIGVASVTVFVPPNVGLENVSVPVFNLPPAKGEPARFGFEVYWLPVVLTTSLRTGSDYGVDVQAHYLSQAGQVLASSVTLWGVPGDRAHDSERGWGCIDARFWAKQMETEAPCASEPERTAAMLTMPTSCPPQPPEVGVAGESWEGAQLQTAPPYAMPAPLSGCNVLPFSPTLQLSSESHAGATPSGMTIHLHLPQEATLAGASIAEASLRRTTLSLPPGVLASAGAADGLGACEATQIGFTGLGEDVATQLLNDNFTPSADTCPPSAKLGTVSISTPFLEDPLEGSVYLAKADTAPFLGDQPSTPLVLYISAEDPRSGVRVKLAGALHVDPSSGQLTTVFEGTPPVPFEDLTVKLFGGPQASQSTPPFCGVYEASASFESWGGQNALSSSPLVIDESCQPAGAPRPLAPSFEGGSVDNHAGAFSPFVIRIGHPDADQPITGISLHLPPGLAAMLSRVSPCPEPASPAEPWQCGAASEIGHATTVAGLGEHPVSLGGTAYLTSGYDGAPFGLLVQTRAQVGPFDLGTVNVRSRIEINPSTAAVTVTTDPGRRTGTGGDALPTMIKGIPAQIKAITVAVDRPEFQFNPTNCEPLSIDGVLGGAEGASAPLHSAFQAADCATLRFGPTLTASTYGTPSRANGIGMKIVVRARRGQANIHATELQFPSSLPSRQSTLKLACPSAVFQANPAACPPGSVIGSAKARTPVLRSPLSGPIYLVSYGNAAFPDAEFVLQGEGIELVLDGHTDIKKGVTYSRFKSLPDAPVETFEATLPPGPHSIFGVYGDLCARKQTMPTTLTGQNGIVLQHKTVVATSGCHGVRAYKATKLARALHGCRHRHRAGAARRRCEATARRMNGHSSRHVRHTRRRG